MNSDEIVDAREAQEDAEREQADADHTKDAVRRARDMQRLAGQSNVPAVLVAALPVSDALEGVVDVEQAAKKK